MEEVNISKIITIKRKEKKVTQDDLAKFLGVSKASVSKWETGNSYPDIVLLPKLAAYFNISLDELMGYDPQMTIEDIRKLYVELSMEFSARPFDEVKGRCNKMVKKYFSCFSLLFQIGVLYINYGWTSKDEKQKISTIREARDLFVRVKEESGDMELKQHALHLEATCEMMLGNPKRIVDLLKDVSSPPSKEALLSQAQIMLGNIKEAKTELQRSIFTNIMGIVNIIPMYISLYKDDTDRFREIYRRTAELIGLFNLKEVIPTGIMPFYLVAAHGYIKNDRKRSLDILEAYTDIATGDIYPLTLMKQDGFFDMISVSLKECRFGTAELPRDETSIKQSMADAVIEDPAFSALVNESRFRVITERLKDLLPQK
jgi:transcriptional regulator with XRE-family HTH domain